MYARAVACATWRRTSAALASAMRRALLARLVAVQAGAATIGTVSWRLPASWFSAAIASRAPSSPLWPLRADDAVVVEPRVRCRCR